MSGTSIHSILQNWDSHQSGPFFQLSSPPRTLFGNALPSVFLDLVPELGGREGFLGQQYIRFYRYEELIDLNTSYDIPNLLPEVYLFASNGYGEAFAFVVHTETIVQIPLIPIPADQADIVAPNLEEFLFRLSNSGPSPTIDISTIGTEVHLKQPICFGGSWKDPANIVHVTPTQHAELCRYWNPLYRNLLKQKSDSPQA